MGYHRSLTIGGFLIILCCTYNCANGRIIIRLSTGVISTRYVIKGRTTEVI